MHPLPAHVAWTRPTQPNRFRPATPAVLLGLLRRAMKPQPAAPTQ